MSREAHSPNIRYAIIQASSAHDSLVLAYADEKALRNLIAEPSIVALGFASRSAAPTAVADSFQRSILSQQMHAMPAPGSGTQRYTFGVHFGMSRLTDGLRNWKGHSVAYRAVQFGVATVVLVLYSRNIVSAAIRTVLGV